MILNRHWYERFEGRGQLDDYRASIARLSPSEWAELLAFLSDRNPALYQRDLEGLPANLKAVGRFYVPISKTEEAAIRQVQRARLKGVRGMDMRLTDEEVVEDAGLDDDAFDVELAALPYRKAS